MWFWLSLLSAIISAVSIGYNKKAIKGISTSLFTWSLFVFPIPLLFLVLLKQGWTKTNQLFFLSTGLAAFFFTIAKTLSLDAIKKGLLSKIIPLKSFGSLFVYLFGLIALGESLKLIALIGLMLIISGTYLLNINTAKEDVFQPFKLLIKERQSLIIIMAMVFSSIVAVLEKVSLKNLFPANPFFLTLIESVLIGLLLTAYLIKKHQGFIWIKQVKQNFWPLLAASLIYVSLPIVVFAGFAKGPIALVTAIKKLEIVFVLLLSWFLFNDRPAKHTWLGTLLMLIGAILIKSA